MVLFFFFLICGRVLAGIFAFQPGSGCDREGAELMTGLGRLRGRGGPAWGTLHSAGLVELVESSPPAFVIQSRGSWKAMRLSQSHCALPCVAWEQTEITCCLESQLSTTNLHLLSPSPNPRFQAPHHRAGLAWP